MPSKIISQELKQEIVNEYLKQPVSLQNMTKRFNLCSPTISKILHEANIEIYSKSRVLNPNMNENYFSNIDDEHKAYYIGLIIADGNIFQKNNLSNTMKLSITLHDGDEYILEQLISDLCSSNSITNDGRGCSEIGFSNTKLCKDLEQYGIVPRKSLITYLPTNIPDDLMRHLIRGLIDGDGSIRFVRPPRRCEKYISLCGTHRLMQEVLDYLYEHKIIKIHKQVYDYKNSSVSEFKISNKDDIYSLGEWLYKDATIYLKRKKEIYDSFKEYYNLD